MRNVYIVEDDEVIAAQVAKHLETWDMKAIVVIEMRLWLTTLHGSLSLKRSLEAAK